MIGISQPTPVEPLKHLHFPLMQIPFPEQFDIIQST